MIHATMMIEHDGEPLWTGSLYAFARANDLTREEVAELVRDLRTLNEGRPQPASFGGGAAPLFHIHLIK